MAGLIPTLSSVTGGVAAKAIKSVAAEIVGVRTGTVVSDLAPTHQTQVVLDDDPSRVVVVGQGINFPLPKDTRVMCLKYPPRGLVVLGAVSSLPDPYAPYDSGWIYVGDPGAPAFQNGWTNFASGGYQPARFRRVGNRVTIEGMVAGGTLNTAVFTLPAGFRPPALLAFGQLAQQAQTGAASAGMAHTHQINHSMAFYQVFADGRVYSASGHVTNNYQSLSGIEFFVD